MINNQINTLHNSGVPKAFGAYHDLVEQPSTSVWDGNGGLLSARRTKRKTWLFIGANEADWCLGFAIVDAGLLAKAFVYAYHLPSGRLLEDGVTLPLGFPKSFDPNLHSDWQLKNFRIQTEGQQLKATYQGDRFELEIDVQLNNQGLSFLCPSKGARPFHYTYKNLLLPAKVTLREGEKSTVLSAIKAGIDFSKGYPPRHTFWNWTSFMGETENGIPIGINLVDGFNDHLENAIWIGDEKILVGKVLYDYEPPLESSPWEVNAVNGTLQLQLTPRGQRKENINVKVLKSKFIQVYGAIRGKLFYKNQWHQLSGNGVMEEHEALW